MPVQAKIIETSSGVEIEIAGVEIPKGGSIYLNISNISLTNQIETDFPYTLPIIL